MKIETPTTKIDIKKIAMKNRSFPKIPVEREKMRESRLIQENKAHVGENMK